MGGRSRDIATLALVLAGLGLMGGCGDDAPTGPQFGDLVFSPSSTVLVGDDRSTVLTVRNSGPRDLGPILIGLDVIIRAPRTVPDSSCTGARLTFVPSTIPTLAEGGAQAVTVSIDLSDPRVTPASCPAGMYDAGILAFVNDQGLARASIQFDWDGTPP
jgi:hypothetical protein